MTTIALVSCVKAKRACASAAKDLYLSALFVKLRRFAEARSDKWYILSAEHGLLDPEEIIEPYDKTLNAMPVEARREWAARVGRHLLERLVPGSTVVLLAGQRYREGIEPFLRSHGFTVEVPLRGLPIGKQLQYLTSQT